MVLRSTLTMLPIRASGPKKKSLVPNLIEKGLIVLRKVASRDEQTPEWKLRQQKCSLSRSAQAICRYYKKLVRGLGSRDGPATHGYLEMTCFSAGSKASRVEGRWGILNKLGRWVEMGRFWGVDGAWERRCCVCLEPSLRAFLRRRERGKRK